MATPKLRQSIADVFAQARSRDQIALMPFVPAGYPDLPTTAALLPAIEAAGASIIEVGIPFSDPIADGPIIQEAFNKALSKKLKLADIFETIKSARPGVSIPLVAMVSYSIAYRHGIDQFIRDAADAGFDGLILPDLPPPDAEKTVEKVRSGGLDTTLLVAPTTSPNRRREIARLSSGFIYYLSVTGITGERNELPSDLRSGIANMKSLTDLPVCSGFGISKPSHVLQLQGVADGAIVGSAVVRRIAQNEPNGQAAMIEGVANYCRELLSALPASSNTSP